MSRNAIVHLIWTALLRGRCAVKERGRDDFGIYRLTAPQRKLLPERPDSVLDIIGNFRREARRTRETDEMLHERASRRSLPVGSIENR